ncbi:Potassium efflux system protein phaB [Roseomonas mucosa]|uniref:MnhB domain-containing protein n=1 Tax=Roseomonas TaxID=125216 RepID=UPI00095F5937|nr:MULTISPECIES: MnhB domain-containing protein [Roseomonas]MDT8262653.1 MnhB domain-containing protein [Roseomonas sp. DSM 102946]ATR21610.1 sodium:proton antiporter [Roseomonas sp. FDAARGOS_362]USQ70323.1 sodium:proton antiporter [Roseomonas mucosa]UZO95986.1 Potassium efflux system protein phaB [Roseomonas mucosa]GAV32376.1 putative monovalent cation/H+ antiporter subunit [Roseomonas sp. TAS13]
MTPRLRCLLAWVSALCLLPWAAAVIHAMPEFGNHPLPYGDAVNRLGPAERQVTNMVTAVNFDLRGFDTLGEEVMLLAAVVGTTVILRGARGEKTMDRAATCQGRPIAPRSPGVILLCRVLAPMTLLYGLYVVLHAALTPGGGFQGGMIIGSGLLLVWLGERYGTWRRVVRGHALHAAEAGGAALYALVGMGALLSGGAFLANLLPLGEMGSLLSGGIIPVVNLGVGLAVAGGFGMLFLEFLEETRVAGEDGP